MNYLEFPLTFLANQQRLFKQANHGAYSNLGTKVGTQNKDLALFHRPT